MDPLDARLAAALQKGLGEGEWDTAIREVRAALVDHSSSAKALLALAVCYFHKRQFVDSIVWLDQAARQAGRLGDEVAFGGTWSAIYLFRGLSYAARRLPTAARAEFQELKRLDPTPIRWRRFAAVLRPDEMTRARLAAEGAGLISRTTGGGPT
jgi:tetratricopeptide (TPR) repeat protein